MYITLHILVYYSVFMSNENEATDLPTCNTHKDKNKVKEHTAGEFVNGIVLLLQDILQEL